MSSGDLGSWFSEWRPRYPADVDEEDAWLNGYFGKTELTEEEVVSLINWKFKTIARNRVIATRGLDDPGWSHKLRASLTSADDYEALKWTAALGSQGIRGWGPALGSVPLAVTQPSRFTIMDTRAFVALKNLGRFNPGVENPRLKDWVGYLDVCRSMASELGVTLRDLDRALWAAGGA